MSKRNQQIRPQTQREEKGYQITGCRKKSALNDVLRRPRTDQAVGG
jgi:hypothetical protein